MTMTMTKIELEDFGPWTNHASLRFSLTMSFKSEKRMELENKRMELENKRMELENKRMKLENDRILYDNSVLALDYKRKVLELEIFNKECKRKHGVYLDSPIAPKVEETTN